jgi:hypothetical protein
MRGWTRALAVIGGLLLAGCSTTAIDLTYDARKTVSQPARVTVDVAPVTDARKRGPNWLGAVRGGFGEPLQTVTTAIPVADVVRAAFADGLKARGLSGPYSQYLMRIEIEQFDCNQYLSRQAHAIFNVSMVQKSSGRLLYQRQTTADQVGEFTILESGYFAKVEDLRKVANDALQAAVDQSLDDPQFLALVR